MFTHWQRIYQSIILKVVYLNSERQNNNQKNPEKHIKKKLQN